MNITSTAARQTHHKSEITSAHQATASPSSLPRERRTRTNATTATAVATPMMAVRTTNSHRAADAKCSPTRLASTTHSAGQARNETTNAAMGSLLIRTSGGTRVAYASGCGGVGSSVTTSDVYHAGSAPANPSHRRGLNEGKWKSEEEEPEEEGRETRLGLTFPTIGGRGRAAG